MKLPLYFDILLLCFVAVIVQGGSRLPEFNDPIHGKLIVSRVNPPFLTLKAHPNRAYYVPTDEQVRLIRDAVYGGKGRFKRSSNDSIIVGNIIGNSDKTGDVNSRRIEILQLKFASEEEMQEEESGLDLPAEAFEKGMKVYTHYSKYIGRMIIDMFQGYVDADPVPPPDLPFSTYNEKTYFKASIIETKKMKAWLGDVFTGLKLHAKERRYFPVEKVMQELRECLYVESTEVTDKDFQFKTKQGGMMSYYKVKCLKIETNVFVFMALNDNEFTLKPKTADDHETDDASQECSACSGCFCYLECDTVQKNKKTMFQGNRHLTAAQQRELNDYLIDSVVQRIKIDFKNKIALAMEDHNFLI